MSDCNEYIEKIYKHPKIDSLIKNIKPIELQDDLRQEMALVLLDYDCEKLIKISEEGKLVNFTMSIIWKMGTLQNGKFYKTYKKKDFHKAIEYLESQKGKEIPETSIVIAQRLLKEKLNNSPNDAHESIIFNKYIELQSCQKVANYFGVPRLHVFNVVNKTKEELKKAIKNDN